jgi:hypothetical protein
MVGYGPAGFGRARRGMVWRAHVRCGMPWHCGVGHRSGPVMSGLARIGLPLSGVLGCCVAWCGEAGNGMARFGMVRAEKPVGFVGVL